jgi:hypothetical protein
MNKDQVYKLAQEYGIETEGIKFFALRSQVLKAHKSSTPQNNTATILNGDYEVRVYTSDNHGDNFADLAEEFASNNNYKVVYTNTQIHKCPNCGYKLE